MVTALDQKFLPKTQIMFFAFHSLISIHESNYLWLRKRNLILNYTVFFNFITIVIIFINHYFLFLSYFNLTKPIIIKF